LVFFIVSYSFDELISAVCRGQVKTPTAFATIKIQDPRLKPRKERISKTVYSILRLVKRLYLA
jgi:hypothetical protein